MKKIIKIFIVFIVVVIIGLALLPIFLPDRGCERIATSDGSEAWKCYKSYRVIYSALGIYKLISF